MAVYRQPGTVITDHTFLVPLDHADPAGERIQIYAREVVAAGKHDHADRERLPWLLFLQGGPGGRSPRPLGSDSWLSRALEDYRVLLLDQRGTGRSTPATRQTLPARGDASAQASYLAHFRADSIVADCELIRRELLGEDGRWSLLGQSYGGFCALTYLSFAPAGYGRRSSPVASPGFAAAPRTPTGPHTRASSGRWLRTTPATPRTSPPYGRWHGTCATTR